MTLQYKIFIFLLMLFAISCSASRNNTSPTTSSAASKFIIKGPANAVAYVEKYKHIAISESIKTGIPASIKLAQGILESGYGSSHLAQKANNHFGIKTGSGWKGKTIVYKGSSYRNFKSGEDAYKEHSQFLVNGSRYKQLFKLKRTDYKGWANGLRKAGYAESAKYPAQLIELIERYQLYNYDK